MLSVQITPEDIQTAERIMSRDFSDPERAAILQSMDSCDIQACPGSGKTTTMVAKLVILSEKLRGTNFGVCALSHTNAARDEIEKSLGKINSPLLRYPHFVGTIQSFVDTFLAFPAYQKKHNRRPVMIGDEYYEYIASQKYQLLLYGTRYYLAQNRSRRVQQQNLREQYAKDYFAKLSFRFDNLDEFIYFENNVEQPFMANSSSPSYQDILRVKNLISQDGYLTYHDAFSYANWYLGQHLHFSRALSLRFPFVFVDEMQDTDQYQLSLINKMFDNSSVVQKFGDTNQTIYNNRNDDFERAWIPQVNLQITSSKRLSNSIARLSQSLGVSPQNIVGNPDWPDHNHTIIRFAATQAIQVIPVFSEILEQEHLTDGSFVALGAVAKQHLQELTIPNYWPSFERKLSRQTTTSTLWEDFGLAKMSIAQDHSFLLAKKHLLNGVVKVLRSINIRTHDGHSFTTSIIEAEINKRGLQQKLTLNSVLINWVKCLNQNSVISENLLTADLQSLAGLIDIQLEEQEVLNLLGSLTQTNQNLVNGQAIHSNSNFYHHSAGIDVHVNTIHSAKGQTHKATLLLETFYNQYDLEQIKSYLWGQPVRRPGKRIKQRFLPLSYVACTRPTHLLCLAILGDHLSDQSEITRLQNYGWRSLDL